MKFSLRGKSIILIVLIAAILGSAGVLVSNHYIKRLVDDSYKNRAYEIANTVAVVLDADQVAVLKSSLLEIYQNTEEKVISDDWGSPAFDAYIARFSGLEDTPEYHSIFAQLRKIQDVNDVDCLYISTIDIPTEKFIYLVDAAEEDPCPPGCLDPIYEENRDLLTDPERGFPPYITDTEPYGWLVTAGVPVYNDKHEIVCYAMVDISMEAIRAQQNSFTRTLGIVLLLLTVLICGLSILLIDRMLIDPINMLSHAAAHYNAGVDSTDKIDSLKIKTEDEIQSLYISIKQMMHDINRYIDNLMSTTYELTQTRIKADKMNELAHRDALTGVGSKLAYDQKAAELADSIREGKARFGIVMVDTNDLKKLNDTYGHERGNDAIRNTSRILCDVFKHSPVYRIGGDEFVVVLEGRDYNDISDLMDRFHLEISKLQGQPWEKISAAIGYALYDDEVTVDEVFRKADHIMYVNKQKMKAGAAV